MNRLDSSSSTLIYSSASYSDHESVRRFIVLISTHSDYAFVTRRLSELANASGAQVLFLGLCKDAAHELSLRRELATLSALLQDAKISAQTKIETGKNWVDIVRSNYRDGDMIVCFAEQHAGLLRRPLSQILQSNLNAPIYILSDFPAQNKPQSNWLSQIMAWSGSVGIIIGFFLLQIRITSYPQDWAQTTLMILSVIGETWLIWVWNELVS